MPIPLRVPVRATDWQQGPPDAPVTLVEYGDFQCEDCILAYPLFQQLRAQFGDRLRFVYRHLPLTDVHLHALDAARAAEAAGTLGKFWEMHAILFERAPKLSREDLVQYAEQIGLSAGVFAQAFEAPQSYTAVREDVDGLRPTGIGKTPTLFLNSVRYEGPITLSALSEAIASAGAG